MWYPFGPVKKTGRGWPKGPWIFKDKNNKMNLRKIAFLMVGLLPLGVFAQTTPPQVKISPPNSPGLSLSPANPASAEMPDKKKLSYAIGMYFGRDITNRLAHGQVEIDTNILMDALTTVVSGKPAKLSEKEVADIFNQLRAAMRVKMESEQAQAKAKGDAFLSQFAKSPGTKTLPDGLEFKVIQDGTGPMPKGNDTVTVAYRGTLIDGTEFDRRDTFTTPVHGGIIKGWQEILPLMKVGSKYQIAIPPDLGYGPRGRQPKIPGNSVLVFDMELKSIAPPAAITPATTPGFGAGSPPAPTTPVVSGEIIKVPSAEELKNGAKIEVIKGGQTNAAPSK